MNLLKYAAACGFALLSTTAFAQDLVPYSEAGGWAGTAASPLVPGSCASPSGTTTKQNTANPARPSRAVPSEPGISVLLTSHTLRPHTSAGRQARARAHQERIKNASRRAAHVPRDKPPR